MVISSRQNAKIKRVASLKDKKYRQQYGEYVVEGVKMVKEAILMNVPVVEILGTQDALNELPACTAPITVVDDKVFDALTETKTPQGVLAVLKQPENILSAPRGNCVVLDGVSDPGNVGTIIRTCAALGIKDVYLCNCADAFSPKTIRSSMSGVFFVQLHSFDRHAVNSVLEGSTIVVADMNGEDVFTASVPSPYAIVVGNEANGVSEFFRLCAKKVVSIPMEPNVESLNAAVSLAVIGYALRGKKAN